MKHYIEITLTGSPDFPLYHLWSKLYTQLHLALVENRDASDQVNIGVSFPEYYFNEEKGMGFLGTKLRLFAEDETSLQKIDIQKWFVRLNDCIHITPVCRVPLNEITGYATFSRKHIKSNAERLARRQMKRHKDLSFHETVQRYQKNLAKSPLPFIQLESLTNSHPFKLFIEKKPAINASLKVFTTYGLSAESTIPEF
ncbi:type I-F CRISPR-associated endoribonuclease Cas6/Csy4 [Oxalobacter formigenes]|uniref:CRISPR-derived RNA endonuclease Csy4 n=2 Tax=Oxalobacter formigenes TaxID=847 RepID=C3X8E2_OXAFO|nr:type I-F CRISPR-associated endoribonuclease Cas6/Csy4 [Oxalobacter formigenes]ARQ46492.1 CRISPR-associated endonuclease Cas6/Csy4 [Oxalobacter formigenes]ARQ78589.1 type I-F CRISPR-associated endoribonuclease Cas6/Csy4 [Oxalobacter formigenes OXCC13]EEO29468.1 CRISPR-derived RNA endonuclease Csy4 [Oxalobacter formigenes OXCC13]MCZ4061704.1 type I-F CRISPR-associated endoribonuclease Cas6/Csy4 [Oxalobacter formigenes]QDX32835.1 type I-F CRISPR-associated endoribonuclease Cas6/Csy4 [Oxalobact